MAAILRVSLTFFVILLIYSNSANGLKCYQCKSSDKTKCTFADKDAIKSCESMKSTVTPPSSGSTASSESTASSGSTGSSESTASSESTGSSGSPVSTASTASSGSTESSSSTASTEGPASSASTTSSASTEGPVDPVNSDFNDLYGDAGELLDISRQSRSLLLNRFQGINEYEDVYYCYTRTYKENANEVVERGCTQEQTYCETNKDKSLSCKTCTTEACNSSGNARFMPALLVFAVAAIILR